MSILNSPIMETIKYNKFTNRFEHYDDVIVRRQPAFKHLLHLNIEDDEVENFLIYIPKEMREERQESERFFALLDENNKAMAYSSNKELLMHFQKKFFPDSKFD